MFNSYFHFQKIIEAEINKNPFIGSPPNLYEPLNYIMALGGKRIRPMLTLMACQMYSGEVDKAIAPALAVEVFHNFSLIHDDILDQATLRRGNPTIHKKWDVNNAILSGDLMLVKAYEMLLKSEPENLSELLIVFNKTAIAVCEGQQMDMNFETQTDVSENNYLEMIRLKTSVLLGCSLQMGAIVANVEELEANKIYNLGVNMGMGFQLMDDYLDTFGTQDKIGKRHGGDILAGKKTILYIKTLETKKEKFLELINNNKMPDANKINQVQDLFINSGSDNYLKNLSAKYFSEALNGLIDLDVEESKKNDLNQLLVYLQTRSF